MAKKVEEISGIVLGGVFHERVVSKGFLDCAECSLKEFCDGTGNPCNTFDQKYAGHHFEERGMCKIEGSGV